MWRHENLLWNKLWRVFLPEATQILTLMTMFSASLSALWPPQGILLVDWYILFFFYPLEEGGNFHQDSFSLPLPMASETHSPSFPWAASSFPCNLYSVLFELEVSLAFYLKLKSLLGITQEKWKQVHTKTCMQMFWGSFIHNGQWKPLCDWMNKLVHPHNRIQCSNKKKLLIYARTWSHLKCSKYKLVTKGYVLYDSIFEIQKKTKW